MNKYREQSKYCYSGTDILINHFDIRDSKKLEELETTISYNQISTLNQNPIYGAFGLTHLKKIHKFIFGDIYPFAGQFREEQISKGSTYFAHPLHLETYANDLFRNLKNEKFLKGMDYNTTISRLSFYLSEINILHPFREGNGRTQREFIRLLALKNGYELDFQSIDTKRMIDASIKSVSDQTAFEKILDESFQNKTPDLKLIKQFSSMKKDKGLEL